MQKPTIHHIQTAIPKGGEAQALAFYGQVLGLEEIPKPEHLQSRGGVWFRTGNLELHLGVDPAFVASRKAHIAFQFDDLERVREALLSDGFAVEVDEPLPDFERFYTSDPFGNRVELLAPTDQDTPGGAEASLT
jgi:catechol 2,3-dioxygenase-like lactoylglutathione lyase family enzyme